MSEVELYRTERLLVRRFEEADLDALYAVYSDAEAMRWVGDGRPITRDECLRWFEVTRKNYATRGYGMSVLELLETGAIVGFCGFVHPGGQPEVEIKYALLREYWGRGLATEAVSDMIRYGARTFGMTTIIATTAPANTASHRVLEKSGMELLEERASEDGSRTRVFAWRAGRGAASGRTVE